MYSQIEAIKLKYATARFVSWRDLKTDAINQRWLLSLYAHCRHFHPFASVFAVGKWLSGVRWIFLHDVWRWWRWYL